LFCVGSFDSLFFDQTVFFGSLTILKSEKAVTQPLATAFPQKEQQGGKMKKTPYFFDFSKLYF
jgi:hypothetical protein